MIKRIISAGIVSGLAMLVVGMATGQIYNFMFPGVMKEYINPAIFRSWNDPRMTLYFFVPLIYGLILAVIWNKGLVLFSGRTYWNRVFLMAAMYWLMTIPGMMMTYSSFNVSFLMVLSWTLSNFVEGFVGAMICAGMLFRKNKIQKAN